MKTEDLTASMESFFDKFIGDPSGARYLVGVSGGRDSMVLLDALNEFRKSSHRDFSLIVLHYNYRLHEDAGEARCLVREYSQKLGFRCWSAESLAPERLKENKRGFEAAARERRYDFFRNVFRISGAKGIFLAHHRLDQVETILLNLGRGTGLHGLAGMEFDAHLGEVRVYRPLLDVNHELVRKYLKDHEVPFVDDPSNTDRSLARNRIRHEILPEWRKAQPDPERAIFNLGEKARLENEFWDDYVRRTFKHWRWPNELQVGRNCFGKPHKAAQFRFLHYLIREFAGEIRGWDEQNITDLRELFLNGRSGAKLSLPGPVRAINERNRGCLFRTDTERWDDEFEVGSVPFNRALPGVGKISISEVERSEPSKPESTRDGFCSHVREEPDRDFLVRTWNRGDRYDVNGDGPKLKKLFDDESIPYRARRMWPLIVLNEQVVAVPGLTESDMSGDNVLSVRFNPEHPSFHQIPEVSDIVSRGLEYT